MALQTCVTPELVVVSEPLVDFLPPSEVGVLVDFGPQDTTELLLDI